MKTVYVIAMEGNGPTGCEWFHTAKTRDAAAGKTGAEYEVLFTLEVEGETADKITAEVDAECWAKPWLGEESDAPTYEELVAAQTQVWPDSRIMTVREVLTEWVEPSAQRTLALTLQDGVRVFYECGKQGDGTYRWRGCRYGVEGPDYYSGFGKV